MGGGQHITYSLCPRLSRWAGGCLQPVTAQPVCDSDWLKGLPAIASLEKSQHKFLVIFYVTFDYVVKNNFKKGKKGKKKQNKKKRQQQGKNEKEHKSETRMSASVLKQGPHERFKRTLFIRTKHNMRILGSFPVSSYKTTLKQRLKGEKRWHAWHDDSTAQPKTDQCPGSPSHFSSFFFFTL